MVWAPRRLAREKPFAILCSGVCCCGVIITSGQSSKPFGRRFGKASVRERERKRERENRRQPLSLVIALSLPRRNASRGKKRGNETRRTETDGADPRLETSTTTEKRSDARDQRAHVLSVRRHFFPMMMMFPLGLGICASPKRKLSLSLSPIWKKVTHASSSSSSSSSLKLLLCRVVFERRRRRRQRSGGRRPKQQQQQQLRKAINEMVPKIIFFTGFGLGFREMVPKIILRFEKPHEKPSI